MAQGILLQCFALQWCKTCCGQFYTYSQWFAENFDFSKFSVAAKCSECLKYVGCLSKLTVSQGILLQFFALQCW